MYKNVTLSTRKMAIPAARPAAGDANIMTYINTQHSASKYTITACRAKVKFKVCLDVGRIIDNYCHFYIVLMGTLGLIFSIREGRMPTL